MRVGCLFLSGEVDGDCLEGTRSGGCEGVGGGPLLFLGFFPLVKMAKVRVAVLDLAP